MIHERLQSLDIKITELAKYLHVSRPTMYKYIDAYDRGDFNLIQDDVLKLFDYIMNNDLIDKRNVISFLLTPSNIHNNTDENNFVCQEIMNYVSTHGETEKAKFIYLCIKESFFDLAIHYLMEISPLLSKDELTQKEIELLLPYKEIISIYTKKKGE